MTQPTSTVLAVSPTATDSAAGTDGVPAFAESLASLLGLTTRAVAIGAVPDRSDVRTVLDELGAASSTLAVLPCHDLSRLCWPVLQRARKPVVLVPPAYRDARAIGRALIPLDGTPEAAAAVAETVALLGGAGVDLVVLHVFRAETVPRFWDHPGHADVVWRDEFLARNLDLPGVRLQVRSGTPGEHVLDVAAAEQVDLIALGWSQHLDEGRALTLRDTVGRSPVPVLIVPCMRTFASRSATP